MTNKLTIKGIVKPEIVTNKLNILSVSLRNQNGIDKTEIATSPTDKNGVFKFELNTFKLKRFFNSDEREVYFVIRKGDEEILSTKDELVVKLDKDVANIELKLSKALIVSLEPTVPKLPQLDLDSLLKSSGVKASELSTVQKRLKESNLSSLASILSKQDKLTTGGTGLTDSQLRKFKSLTQLSAAAGSEQLGKKLVSSGFSSLTQLGNTPHSAIKFRAGKLSKADAAKLDSTIRIATTIARGVDDSSALNAQIDSTDYPWLRDLKLIPAPRPPRKCNCSDCNVFSPYAYLLSLIDMLNDHWQLSITDLEKMLLQNIGSLECSSGETSFAQNELAVEVLEKSSRTKLPVTDSTFKKSFEIIWARLLIDSATSAEKAREELKNVELGATAQEKKLIKLFRNPAQGLKDIRTIKEKLEATPKLSSFTKTSLLYADKDNEQFLKALEQSYIQAVKLYRDTLISSTNKSVEFLQNELFVDFKAGSCQTSNRINFLILCLQAVILSGRTGQLKNTINPDITGALRTKLKTLDLIPLEELSWKWMKDYPTWASAMYVFLYPENAALPFLYTGLWVSNPKFKNSSGVQQVAAIRNTHFAEFFVKPLLSNPQSRRSIFSSIFDYYNSEEALRFFKRESSLGDNHYFFDLASKNNTTTATDISVSEFMRILEQLTFEFGLSSVGFDDVPRIVFREPQDKNEYFGINTILYIPLVAGWALNKSAQFESAHEWYQQLYDTTNSGDKLHRFNFNEIFDGSVALGEDWANGILDPNAILHRRQGAMLRHVVLMMVKNLLDWADHEFAKATASSIDRARQLYELAQVTLDAPDLRDHCGESLRSLNISVVNRYSSDSEVLQIIERLSAITDLAILEKAITNIEKELSKTGNPNIDKIEKVVNQALLNFKKTIKPGSAKSYISKGADIRTSSEIEAFKHVALKKELDKLFDNNLAPGSRDPQKNGNDYFSSSIATLFCVPPNPLLVQLAKYTQSSLLKIQLCLDISGESLPPTTISDESTTQFLTSKNTELERQPLAAAGQPNSILFDQPPRYRYSFLIEKARQYTDVAQRIGSSLLAAYQTKDSQELAILNAENAIEMASTTVELKNLGLQDARLNLDIAELQLEKAEDQFRFWDDRLARGLNHNEIDAIHHLELSSDLQIASAITSGAGAIAVGATAGAAGFATSGPIGLAAGVVGALVPGAASALSSLAAYQSTQSSIAQTKASYTRRREDWILQELLSEFDLKIADIQKSTAINRIGIADLEKGIAQLQQSHSQEVLSFLENQFSNTHLYEWMIKVLTQNYRTLMQISASVAKMAQQALEFERQERLTIVSGDYWSINSAQANYLSDKQKSSGLLGAERLITDLTRLDAYKLSSEKRRQQISKSISFAQMLPNELITLKTTGRVTFNTLMNWFDRDYPGNYHRLIKSIRVTMLALTPPTDGIHGSLSNSGESTVVINNDSNDFESIRAFRQFNERIALDSPFNETGLFVFDYNDPMFLPFEGLGVETQWTLELPKAANRFNFNTLVDVVLTIEYTALHSDAYAQEVRELLGDTDSNDISIQPRLQTPDSWYHFINDPLDANNNRVLSLDITHEDLPAHYIDSASTNTHHVSIVVLGDFGKLSNPQRKKLKEAIQVEHDHNAGAANSTLVLPSALPADAPVIAEQFNTNNFNNDSNSLFLSTRVNTDNLLKLGNANSINPLGSWRVIVNDKLANNINFGELVTDIMLIVTTEGNVDWG